jgi:CubicO group peptidase (beta-lactamase class C family)
MMATNQLPGGVDIHTYGSAFHRQPGNVGVGFGLWVSVVVDPSVTECPSSLGTFGWTGAATTIFWVDPRRDLTVQFMTQVRRKSSFSVYPELKRLVHEAVK